MDDEQAAHDRAVERVGRLSPVRSWPATGPGEVHPYYAALLQAPPIADHISALSEWFGAGATFPAVVREWADLVLARELDWNRAFYSHLETALAAGVRGEAARAAWERRTDTLTPEEHELASYLVAVARGTVTPEAAQAIRARYGERMAVEITAFAGYLLLNFRVMQALDVPDRTAEEVAELIERLLPRATVAATSTTLRVNGEERVVDADGATPLLYVLRNALGLTGTLLRLRDRPLRRVLRARRRPCRALVRHAPVEPRRRRRDDRRGAGQGRGAVRRPGGLPRRAGGAVRLLPAGHPHQRDRAAGRRTPAPPRTRCARRWTATSAAAAATRG